MAYEIPLMVLSFKCGSVSLAAKQYYAVKLDTDGTVIVCAATTDRPIGILQNAPGVGETAEVMVIGVSKVNSDAALAIGNEIGPAADGQLAAYVHGTDTTKYIIGTVLRASAAAAGYATAAINCLGIGRAA